jgi:hypothetical protein
VLNWTAPSFSCRLLGNGSKALHWRISSTRSFNGLETTGKQEFAIDLQFSSKHSVNAGWKITTILC